MMLGHGKLRESPFYLLTSKHSNLQWQLWPLVFLSSNHWCIGPRPLYFPCTFWKREVELPKECDQERVHLNNAVKYEATGPSVRPYLFSKAFRSEVWRLTRIAIQCNPWDLQKM